MYYICICNENTFTQNRCQIHPRSIHQRLAPRKRSGGICLYNKGFHHQQPSQYKDTKWVNCGWCGKREYFASYELVNFPLKECHDRTSICGCQNMLGEGRHWMRNRGNAHEYINDDLCTDDARFDGRFDIIV